MNRMANPFDELAAVEHTLQVDGPWCGHFELDGRSVRCAIDRAGWLHLAMPLPGRDKDLVREHERLLLPIKIVPGPAFVGEMPCDGDLTSAFEVLRAALHRGVDLLESEPSRDRRAGPCARHAPTAQIHPRGECVRLE